MNLVTYTELRKNLKHIMDVSSDQHEPVVISRSNKANMILMSLEDYESLKETAYLLSSETNARHLRKSIKSFKAGKLIAKDLW